MSPTRAQRVMASAEGVDALVIANGQEPFLDPSFRYLTGNHSGIMEGGLLLVHRDGSMDVVVSRMEESSARRGEGRVHSYQTGEERDGILGELFQGIRRLGVNSGALTFRGAEHLRRILPAVELTDVSAAISSAMSIKDEEEVAAIREACRISSRVAGLLPSLLREGATESELRGRIDILLREEGGQGNAFDTIVAFGEGAAEPHHEPSRRALARGDVALFDFGCRYEGYCSDLTRTLFLGEPDPVLARAYETVLRAKEAGMGEIRAGARASDADAAARRVIDESEFKGLFLHSFGHGIGMSVHEGGSLSPKSDLVLEAGMVVSAEPGVYIEGLGGIRIEDTVLVLEDGCEALTDFDQGMTVV